MKSEYSEDISIYRMFIYIVKRIPILAIIAIIGFILAFAVVNFDEAENSIRALVEIDDISGINCYSPGKIIYQLKNGYLKNPVIDKYSLKEFEKNIKIYQDEYTGFIHIDISKTPDVEFWKALIEDSVKDFNEVISIEYRNEAAARISYLDNIISSLQENSVAAKDNVMLDRIIVERAELSYNLQKFEDALVFVEIPDIYRIENASPFVSGVKFAIIVFIIGFLVTCIMSFSDNRLLLGDDFRYNTVNGNLVLSISKNNMQVIDERYLKYLSTFISPEEKNICFMPLGEGPYAENLSKALFSSYGGDDGAEYLEGYDDFCISEKIKIRYCCSPLINPYSLNVAAASDRIFVVVDRKADDKMILRSIDYDLGELSCRNISYIFVNALSTDCSSRKFI